MAEEKKEKETKEKKEKEKKDKKKKPNFFVRAWRGTKKWLREMKSELKKVVWPTVKQTRNNTVVVLIVMAIAAVVIWGFDEIASLAVQALISLGG